jgi:hypothetical protein
MDVLEDDQMRGHLQALGRERARAFSWSITAQLTEAAYRSAIAEL